MKKKTLQLLAMKTCKLTDTCQSRLHPDRVGVFLSAELPMYRSYVEIESCALSLVNTSHPTNVLLTMPFSQVLACPGLLQRPPAQLSATSVPCREVCSESCHMAERRCCLSGPFHVGQELPNQMEDKNPTR